ncbi:putative PPE family protein PPE24 [Stylophora pistillata]|uniref:Putative PPE family protein PPE24 n=1 Tax=Stylophora pistillata TaxID=50429 RepID=A0A2B4SCN5_STYPI|nr:putative PPE family protein PPE24 [Stylophora pistillata]
MSTNREKITVDIGVGTGGSTDIPVLNAMINTDNCPKLKSSNEEARRRTAMAVILVKVRSRANNQTIITHSFLDSGSSATFCTESLMRKIGVEKSKVTISLSTLEIKNSPLESYLIRALVVSSDLDENNFVNLPALYKRLEIPVSEEDIPTQEDADQWPHLDGVFVLPCDAEIGLLIGSDVSEALDPVEIRHSENGGPYASRTRIGWAVNGPLGHRRHGSQAMNPKEGDAWHIPHHGIYHPHKPGKIRVLFDCLAKFMGLLNGMLDKGPDLTNSLVGVLTRFCEDRVAVMADIEAMFYQSLLSVAVAIAHVNNLQALPARGGFRLTKWVSNSREVLQAIPESERCTELRKLDFQKDELPAQRALGMKWDVELDTFTFEMCLKPRPPTRRGIFSVVSSVFDPLSFIAPFVLVAKQILQDLCRIKIGWDKEHPPEYALSWRNWMDDLLRLSLFSVNRSVLPEGFGPVLSSQLHHFSDALEVAYGSVSYLHLVNGERRVHCSFFFAKSRLAPLKAVSIPRLELSAASLPICQDKMFKREIEMPICDPSVFWIDSMSALRYVKNKNRRFHTVVANRDGSNPDHWYHLEGTINPGDHTSRGLSADALFNCEKGLLGPELLWNPEHHWIKELGATIAIQNRDPEVKPYPVVEFNENLSAAAAAAGFGLANFIRKTACVEYDTPEILDYPRKFYGMGELGMGELGMGELGMGELGMGELGMGELGMGELGMGELGMGELGMGELGMGELGMGELGMGELGMGELGMGELGMGELGMGDLGMGELGMGELGMGELGMGELGMGE